ncbi:MAG TPA: cytidylate kinase-like family protein [Prolixibacteraceae bacterium]|nr:cytidylate kinase-like family protein [Prolixibacteraceae bacterium]
MSDVFHEYMSKRISEVNLDSFKSKPGPVITISRAGGCTIQTLVADLCEQLNNLQNDNRWQIISKEILHESAEKLSIHPKQIKSVFKIKDRSILDDIMQAFLSKDYQLERKVRNTVINVIHRFGIEGFAIIIGRAANIICSDINDSLHIRIDAPLEWRIKKMMRIKTISRDEAINYINETEHDRSNFRHSIKGKEVLCDDFDLTINQSKFSNDEIISIIINALQAKKII